MDKLTKEQKECISKLPCFNEKFKASKSEWLTMGYSEDVAVELAYMSFLEI